MKDRKVVQCDVCGKEIPENKSISVFKAGRLQTVVCRKCHSKLRYEKAKRYVQRRYLKEVQYEC